MILDQEGTNMLKRARDSTIELADLQHILRETIKRDMEKKRDTLAQYARRIDVTNSTLHRFLSGESVVSGGDFFTKLTRRFGLKDFVLKIKRIREILPERATGFARCSKNAIRTAYDLHLAYRQIEVEISFHAFGKLFEPYHDIVVGVLRYSVDACTRLDDQNVNDHILDILACEHWNSRVQKVLHEEMQTRNTLARELQSIVLRIRTKYPEQFATKQSVADAFGIHRARFLEVESGTATFSALDRILKKARDVELQLDQEGKSVCIDTKEIILPLSNTIQDIIEEHGGTTSVLGVPHVLTPEVFREITGDPGNEGIEFLKGRIRFLRGLLNVFSQNASDEIRRRVREEINSDIEELFVAIRIFTFEYPNRLLPLYESQRKTWAKEEEKEISERPITPRTKRDNRHGSL